MLRWMIGGVAVLALLAAGARGDDPPQKKADEAKAAVDAMTARPTKEHERLKRDVGIWDATTKTWMAGPDSPPVESKGTETNTMLGDLWLVSDFRTEFAGQDFRGHGVIGYDPARGKFVGNWVDSMTAKIMLMEGSYDEKAGELTMHMDGTDPVSGKPTRDRSMTKHVDADTRVFTMYTKPEGGPELKVMEITYRRRKG